MPPWLNDVSAVSNHDNGAFNPSLDPSVAFMHTPSSASFDFSQVQNPQLQQRMQNGIVRNGSPAFHNPAYQTQSIVPSKRPRGGSDVYGASPRQAPGALPSSRSQTPQQAPYIGFPGNANGAHQRQAPTPYQHLQHVGSNNASPSPIMQDQHFNPQALPPRMQTVSPSPFSPAPQNYGGQTSPPQSDYGSRVDTPQNGVNPYLQTMAYGAGPQQHFPAPAGPLISGVHNSAALRYGQNAQGMQAQQQQQQMHDMRQQQMVRQLHATNDDAQHRHQGAGLTASSAQMINYQQQAARMQQMQQAMLRPRDPDHFLRQLTQFMGPRNLPFNPNPKFDGRPFHPWYIWTIVMKFGGSKKVEQAPGGWQNIANQFQLAPTAAHEIRSYWQSNLYPYEQTILQSLQQSQQRHRPVPNPTGMPQRLQGEVTSAVHDQFSPVKQLQPQAQTPSAMMHARRPSGADFQTPTKSIMPQQHDMRQPHLNGYAAAQQSHGPHQAQSAFTVASRGSATQSQSTQSRAHQASLTPTVKRESYIEGSRKDDVDVDALKNRIINPIQEEFVPIAGDVSFLNIQNGDKKIASHGGNVIGDFENFIDELIECKPIVPRVFELGNIDIRALTMSLRSGIHAEVRVALDTLATISINPERQHHRGPSLLLGESEDLVDTLIDCAGEQVEFLAESAAEVSDVMLISPYEDVVRGCRCEMVSLLDVPEVGSLEYDLDRAAERLVCISTILRNLSEVEPNHHLLAEPFVVRFMTTVIRYLGTRNMLLRTYRNTLDFSKDIITFLSNVSQAIDLPGKEEALCILHFLLSFAPSPLPTSSGADGLMFSEYKPSTHRYLPAAVDSLAKFLARDDPNRTYYKYIFTADNTSSPPYDLLTRTFALAIAPVPNHSKAHPSIIDVRKPFIAQGVLAADILVSLMPSNEQALARSWLMSQDGFAPSLLRLVSLLAIDAPPIRGMPPQNRHMEEELRQMERDWVIITNRGISILRKLAERAKDIEPLSSSVPISVLPKQDVLLRALRTASADRNVLLQLCTYAGLES